MDNIIIDNEEDLWYITSVDSDMWSRVYMRNSKTQQCIAFECDNNVATSLVKEAYPENTRFEYIEDFLKEKGEDIEMLNFNGRQVREVYGSYDKYLEAKQDFLNKMIIKYKDEGVVFTCDIGTPLNSDIRDGEYEYNPDYPLPFTSKRLKELKFNKISFPYFDGEMSESKVQTFSWTVKLTKDSKWEEEWINEWQEVGKERTPLKVNPILVEANWEFLGDKSNELEVN